MVSKNRGGMLAATVMFCGAVTGPARAQDGDAPTALVDLPPAEFFSAVERLAYGPPDVAVDLWPLLDRCREELGRSRENETESTPSDHRNEFVCHTLGERLAATVDADERERVLSVFDSLPLDDGLRQPLLDGLLTAKLREVLRQLAPAIASVSLPEPPPKLPKRLEAAPSDLQRSWQLQRSLVEAYQGLLKSTQRAGAVSVQNHGSQFEDALRDSLRAGAPADRTIAEMGLFAWGGWCGTGSGGFVRAQGRALMLALSAAGAQRAAAGALLASGGSRADDATLPEGWDRRLLAAMGVDWEEVFLGRVLDLDSSPAEDLARHGSDRSLRLLFAARGLQGYDEESPRLEEQDWYAHALGGIVTPTDNCSDYATRSSLDVERSTDAEPVAPDLQADVLDFLATRVGRGSGQNEAEMAAHVLVRLCRSESLPAFRIMARSSYSKVREAGALALRSLGEPAPKVRPTPPIVVQVTVNGQHPSGLKLHWSLGRSRSGGWTTREETATTATEGTLRLDRDPFLDPKEPVDRITLGTPNLGSAQDTWFEVTRPRPANLERPLVFHVETQALTVSCPEAEHQPLTLRLDAPTDRWGMRECSFPSPTSSS